MINVGNIVKFGNCEYRNLVVEVYDNGDFQCYELDTGHSEYIRMIDKDKNLVETEGYQMKYQVIDEGYVVKYDQQKQRTDELEDRWDELKDTVLHKKMNIAPFRDMNNSIKGFVYADIIKLMNELEGSE